MTTNKNEPAKQNQSADRSKKIPTDGSSRILPQSPDSKVTVVSLDSGQRLRALDELDVLDVPSQRSFEVLVELANKFLDTPVALISLVTDNRQFFLSSNGLGEPWASCRETPLSHSFCQHVVKRNESLVVADAETHELVKNNLAVDELGVKAYLGVPVVLPDGNVIGSFCAIDTKPREWTQDDLDTITKLVELTITELTIKKAARKRQAMLENRLAQAQKMQAIGQLVGGVAHDFNNLLGAIQIQAELIRAKLNDQPLVQLDHIRNTVFSAKTIVQQLLNWSRPSAGQKTAISLVKLITDSLPLISTYSTRFIEISFDPAPCKDTIFADSNKLCQVLLNLCSNSAYAMKSTGGQIRIDVSEVQINSEQVEELELNEGPYVKLRVADNGSGIPKELIPRIHDPYFTTKPVGEGTGLGLWTVYGIVREHGGQVHVESAENQGTTFEIYFPLSDAEVELETSADAKPAVKKNGSVRLLVIDDEPAIANGLKDLFDLSGYHAIAFTNGLEALKLFVEDPDATDVIITDQVMPHISGEELICEFRAIRPSIPIILCSGYSEHLQRKDFETHQADAYIEKPNQFENLVELVENLVEQEN